MTIYVCNREMMSSLLLDVGPLENQPMMNVAFVHLATDCQLAILSAFTSAQNCCNNLLRRTCSGKISSHRFIRMASHGCRSVSSYDQCL